MVTFVMEFKDTPGSTDLNTVLTKHVAGNNGAFGSWPIEVESIALTEGERSLLVDRVGWIL